MTADETIQREWVKARKICGHQILRPIQALKESKGHAIPIVLRHDVFVLDVCFRPPGHTDDHSHTYVWTNRGPPNVK